MNEDRELRAALEAAQARVKALEAELAAERDAASEREALLHEELETLQQYLQQEADARDELAQVVEKLHVALDEAELPERPLSPGENHELVKLRAQVATLKHMQAREPERLAAQETIRSLKNELLRLKRAKVHGG